MGRILIALHREHFVKCYDVGTYKDLDEAACGVVLSTMYKPQKQNDHVYASTYQSLKDLS
jgi:hypothetical protein